MRGKRCDKDCVTILFQPEVMFFRRETCFHTKAESYIGRENVHVILTDGRTFGARASMDRTRFKKQDVATE